MTVNKNKKFNDSKKKMAQENFDLKLENEKFKWILRSVRNQISELLGDNIIKMPDGADEKEQMKHFLTTYYKGLVDLKDIEMLHHGEKKKVSDVLKESKEKAGFDKETTDLINNEVKKAKAKMEREMTTTTPEQVEAKQEEQPKPAKCHNCQTLGIYKRGFCFKCENSGEATKSTNIKDVKATPEQTTFKCSKCGTDGEDEGSFKTRNGKMFCIDCLGDAVGWKAEKK